VRVPDNTIPTRYERLPSWVLPGPRPIPKTITRKMIYAPPAPISPRSLSHTLPTIPPPTKLGSPWAKANPKDDNAQIDPRAPSPHIGSILSRTLRPSLGKSINRKLPSPSKSFNEKASARSWGVQSSASAPGAHASVSSNVRRGIVKVSDGR
jgi:hypothetical protein